MIQSLRRTTGIYRAVAATEAKASLAYNWWVWADFVLSIVSMVIFVYFWHAVYADTATLGGLTLDQTINYVLIARIVAPLIDTRVIFFFGYMIRQGQIAVELTRPLDMQGRIAVETYARLGVFMVQRLPLFLIAWLFLGLRLPHDPAQWLAFAVTLLVGQAVLFMFDWIFACLAFYVTETWGLSVVRVGLGSFFSGAIIPLAMMPLWLQRLAAMMPFAQAVSVPVSFLSGITPASELPRLLLIQLVWLVVLSLASRRIFDVAVRKVTVQEAEMARYLSLYRLFIVQRFKILLEYRMNFFIGSTSTMVLQAASLAALWVVMSQIPSLNGWNLYEVLLIYGLLTLGESITHMFADNLWTIGWSYIRSGDFDRFLVRPIDPLFHLLADRFCHDGIGNFLTGAILVGIAMRNLAIPLTLQTGLYLAVTVLSGGAIFIALNLITATSAFWLTESIPVTQMVFGMNEFAKFPLTIYSRGIGLLLTWIIPYGFVSFYPATHILGKDPGPQVWLAPLVAILFMTLAYRVWRFGLRHYGSTGS